MYHVIGDVKLRSNNKFCSHFSLLRDLVRDRDFAVYNTLKVYSVIITYSSQLIIHEHLAPF